MVRRTLNVGFAAQRVDAAARDPHVAQKQLNDGHGADVLAAGGMVSPAQSVAFRSRLVRNAGGSIDFINLEKVFLGDTGDAGNLIQRVTGIVFFIIWKTERGWVSDISLLGIPLPSFSSTQVALSYLRFWHHTRRKDHL